MVFLLSRILQCCKMWKIKGSNTWLWIATMDFEVLLSQRKCKRECRKLICHLYYAVVPVNRDGASSLCVEYEQEFITPRRQCTGLLDALERNEKSSQDAEEESDLSGEEKVMAMVWQNTCL